MLHDSKALLTLLASLSCGGCARDPLDIPCPDLSPGDLVVTEIHGPQSGEDRYGEWIEVFNASGQAIDLSGLSVRLIRLDGSKDVSLLVRSSVVIEPDAYGVFGKQPSGAEPDYVDYGYVVANMDADAFKIFDSGAIELISCGQQLDIAVYRNLPSRGSLALSGSVSPTSEANDDERNWCVDDLEDANSEQFGIRGTPQEENPPCPE